MLRNKAVKFSKLINYTRVGLDVEGLKPIDFNHIMWSV